MLEWIDTGALVNISGHFLVHHNTVLGGIVGHNLVTVSGNLTVQYNPSATVFYLEPSIGRLSVAGLVLTHNGGWCCQFHTPTVQKIDSAGIFEPDTCTSAYCPCDGYVFINATYDSCGICGGDNRYVPNCIFLS